MNRVLVTDPAGVIVALVEELDGGSGVEHLDGILCPGFVNAHCHLELSHLKNQIPKKSGLVEFLLQVVQKRKLDESKILHAIAQAEDEMIQNGIVAVGDICNNALTLVQKDRGRLHYHNFVEATGFVPASATERFDACVRVLDRLRNEGPAGTCKKQLPATINPHAPYSVSPELFALINDYPDNNLLSIHNQESDAENDFFKKGTGDLRKLYQNLGVDISFFEAPGLSSLQSWLPHFTKEQSIILVHNVCTSSSDMEFINPRHFFCLCPNANLYIGDRLPDVPLLLKYNRNLVIGTDSLASNDQLCILEEVKTLQHAFPQLELATLLQWATSNGSRALQMDKELGSFEKGKQPGLVLITGAEGLQLTAGSRAQIVPWT